MRIKYGQIGVGHAHAGKFSVYAESQDYEVVGIAEPDERLRRAAQESPTYRGARWLSIDELLGEPGLQVVGVETHVRDLLDTAEKCIAADKHVHLDKPAGTSLPQFRRLLDEAARRHLAVQMGYMYRYSPAIVLLRQLLERGWLGEPFEVHAVMSKLVDQQARDQLAEFPGGTMFELGCHLIDLVVGLIGPPDAVHAFPRHSAPAADDLQDNMLAIFEYPRATATIRSSVIEVDGFARRHFVVCGTEGTFHIQPLDRPNVRLTLRKARGKYPAGSQEITVGSYERYVADARDLAQVIRNEKDADYSYEHDFAVQKAILEASGMASS
jgi:predicted dehydrogenase